MRAALAVLAFALGAVLLLPSPAAADNCDIFINPLDCQNTGWAVGTAATMAGGVAVAAAATASSRGRRPRVQENRRQFPDCQAAANGLNSGVEAGSANSPFTSVPSRPRVVRNPDGTFTATAGLTWQFDAANASSTVTRPTWPNMSPADRAAADRFVDAVRAHEEGHHQVVRDVMAQSPRNITANGATADEAVRNLEAERAGRVREAQQKINDRNAAYDQTTDHGRNQAAVGGTNAVLNCP